MDTSNETYKSTSNTDHTADLQNASEGDVAKLLQKYSVAIDGHDIDAHPETTLYGSLKSDGGKVGSST